MKNQIYLLIVILPLFSCKKVEEYYFSKFLMDTYCEVKIVSNNERLVKTAVKEVFDEVNLIDKKFGYSDESEIVKINNFAGIDKVKVSEEVFSLINESLFISEKTEGAFDITVGVLSELWGFVNFSEKNFFKVPSMDEISKTLKLVNYKYIVLDKRNVFLKYKDMKINLGGIAKGYALKVAKDKLLFYGFDNFLINFGGDIYSCRKTNLQPWRVAVQHPRQKNKFLTILNLYTTSCATSGDYERYFLKDAKRYHHIINPKTGFPAEGVISATVLCEDPVLADALATAVFVLDEAKRFKVAEEFGVQCIIVVQKDKKIFVQTTKELRNLNFDL